jgi:hypothetical protein
LKCSLCPCRYHFNTNLLLAPVTKSLKWADGAAVRAELATQVEALLGPKTEADLAPPEKKKKPKVRYFCVIIADFHWCSPPVVML